MRVHNQHILGFFDTTPRRQMHAAAHGYPSVADELASEIMDMDLPMDLDDDVTVDHLSLNQEASTLLQDDHDTNQATNRPRQRDTAASSWDNTEINQASGGSASSAQRSGGQSQLVLRSGGTNESVQRSRGTESDQRTTSNAKDVSYFIEVFYYLNLYHHI
jgi:hypothetical protein